MTIKKSENGEAQVFMKQSIVQCELDEVLGTSEIVESHRMQVHRLTYHPTSWLLVNRILAIVDELTGGRAGWVQRFFTFAFIGGFAACVNLIVFYVVTHFVLLPVNAMLHNAIAFVVASEISLLTNFMLNDYFTFRRMASHRPWNARCARFHVTALTGVALTYSLQFCFNFFFYVPAFFAQALAIFIVLFYNFTFHHVFTYRHKEPAAALLLGGGATLIEQAIIDEIDLDVDALELAPVEAVSSH